MSTFELNRRCVAVSCYSNLSSVVSNGESVCLDGLYCECICLSKSQDLS